MQLERLFTYDDWANREEVARLRGLSSPAAALRLLAHIIGAEWLWITRIRNESAKMAVWPELSLEQCAAEIDRLRSAWQKILQTVDRELRIDYRNSKGESWSNTVDDILTHVAMHGTYHRGQIATIVRQGGDTPAYTDYIQAVRTNAI